MNIYYELYMLKDKIPKNVYETILNKIKSGDFEGAARLIEEVKGDAEIQEDK